GKVSYRKDLALKWMTENGAQYLTMKFTLKDKAFKTLTFTFEVASAEASKDNKAINTVVFESNGTDVTVKVNDGATTPVTVDSEIAFSLKSTDALGVMDAFINEVKIGEFKNVGANYADYSSSSLTPLVISAEMPDGAEAGTKTTVVFKELNGQSFVLNAETGAIAADTAAPVLVVNDEISGFTLGSSYSLDYEVVDVITSTSSITKKMEYYQYNPTDTEAKYEDITTSTYFYDTVYSKSETEKTSVYAEEGKEFVSVRFTLSDATFKDETAAVYNLAWYADKTASPVTTVTTDNAPVSSMSYIVVDKNDIAPKFVAGFDYTAYEEGPLKEAAEKTNAGSGSEAKIRIPSVKGMFEDDDTNYKGLRFNIYYKSNASTSGSSETNVASSSLQFSVANAGWYEFKIVAIDRSGNVTEVKEDGEWVTVTAENVWDLDSVPSFKFEVKNSALKVEDETSANRQSSGLIDVEYSIPEFTVEGPSGYTTKYALYYFDMELFIAKYPNAMVDEDVLASIDYDSLRTSLDPAKIDDYAEAYAKLYAQRLSNRVKNGSESIDADALLEKNADGKAILTRIGDYEANIDDSAYPDNKYQWKESERTFVPTKAGVYVAFAVYTHPEGKFGDTVGAYKIISVNATEDIIPGETQWLKNNIASIILFAIAGVMLIIIIILLLIKPS
ncbi:MAG: hypothetical protein IIX01_00600, partial [Clostridia bacterium]|nr:hypothetical protein [Clostridia bacterium]